jgi:CheY-like chemotaxis protein
MTRKHILIVDDEISILTVLKTSLEKLEPGYDVDTAQDGFTALDKLKNSQYDLVVTDYNMAEMDGLELLETIRYLQPSARTILMTAYGCDVLESESRRLQAYRYLTKPLEIKSFRQVIQQALGDLAVSRPGILVLSDDRYRQVNRMLGQLLADVSARCIFLTDAEGRTIVQTGSTEKVPVGEMASLLGGSIVTLIEAGRILDNDSDAINLAYREGKNEFVYAINVGQQLLLILIVDRTTYSSRLGSVWYYAQRAALDLRQITGAAEFVDPQQIFDNKVDQAFDTELDKLFL